MKDAEQLHGEHPLLGVPRRDAITVAVLAALTAALYLMVALGSLNDVVRSLDESFLATMVSMQSPILTAIAKFLDILGSVYVTLPVRIVLAVFLAIRRRWWHFVAFVAAIVVSEIPISFIKAAYDRPRPGGSLVATTGGSFPSGHAVAASVTAVALVIALFPEGPRRYWWGTMAAFFSLVMALSRAYLAAHWLSDAVAGVMLGTVIALAVALVVHHVQTASPTRRPVRG